VAIYKNVVENCFMEIIEKGSFHFEVLTLENNVALPKKRKK
jgi:hypothetical protein